MDDALVAGNSNWVTWARLDRPKRDSAGAGARAAIAAQSPVRVSDLSAQARVRIRPHSAATPDPESRAGPGSVSEAAVNAWTTAVAAGFPAPKGGDSRVTSRR